MLPGLADPHSAEVPFEAATDGVGGERTQKLASPVSGRELRVVGGHSHLATRQARDPRAEIHGAADTNSRIAAYLS